MTILSRAIRSGATTLLFAVSFGVVPSARADLFISSLSFTTGAAVGGGVVSGHSSNNFLTPQTLISTSQAGNQSALGLQANNGFFRAYASTVNTGLSDAVANTLFELVVGTTTPNTPLLLDFHFVGGRLRGDALYGAGDAQILLEQRIAAAINGSPTVQWGFRDILELKPDPDPTIGFSNWVYTRTDSWDTQLIGLPSTDVESHNYENSGFMETTQVNVHSFLGTLDFGVLQPGETFTLRYQSFVGVKGGLDVPYSGSGGLAELTDPFSLGGAAAPQVSLRGLVLPTAASAPEPGTLALLAPAILGGAVLVARRRRR